MKNLVAYLSQVSKKELVGAIALILLVVVPFLTFAKDRKVYVNNNASGTQDGSLAHPYKTIGQALKHAKKNIEVHIASGTYKENIEIPNGVEVYGSSKNKVIINAKHDDEPVVKMNGKTTLNNVTVKNGKYGIEVGKNDRVSISECIVEKNDKDGIVIKQAAVNDTNLVSISNTIIRKNGRAGIYSEKRRISLINNQITENKSDGVALAAGTSAWIDNNTFNDNRGSGLVAVIDGSQIWIASKNKISHNSHDGIEINSYGGTGKINVKKSKIHDNRQAGIARIERGNFSNSIWNGVVVESTTEFWSNRSGNVPAVMNIF